MGVLAVLAKLPEDLVHSLQDTGHTHPVVLLHSAITHTVALDRNSMNLLLLLVHIRTYLMEWFIIKTIFHGTVFPTNIFSVEDLNALVIIKRV